MVTNITVFLVSPWFCYQRIKGNFAGEKWFSNEKIICICYLFLWLTFMKFGNKTANCSGGDFYTTLEKCFHKVS